MLDNKITEEIERGKKIGQYTCDMQYPVRSNWSGDNSL
jgi:hypothetical protein